MVMDKFESQFADLDVQTSYMESTMSDTTALTTPQDQVDGLINQVADEAGLEVRQGLEVGQVPREVPKETESAGKVSTEEDGRLADRLRALRVSRYSLLCLLGPYIPYLCFLADDLASDVNYLFCMIYVYMFIQSFFLYTICTPKVFTIYSLSLAASALSYLSAQHSNNAAKGTHLIPRLGLLEALGNIIRRHMRSLCVVGVCTSTLESTSLSRLLVEIGRVVCLGRVGQDSEFCGLSMKSTSSPRIQLTLLFLVLVRHC